MSWWGGWRVAVRIGWRGAARAPVRSLLVIAMLAAPVLGVTAVDATVRAAAVSPEEQLTADIGLADARYASAGLGGPVEQSPSSGRTRLRGARPEHWRSPPVADVLPKGAHALAERSREGRAATANGVADRVQLVELDTGDMLGASVYRMHAGRTPDEKREVIASTAFLRAGGLRVGSTVAIGGRHGIRYRISGSFEPQLRIGAQVLVGLPGAVLGPLARAEKAAWGRTPDIRTRWLVSAPHGVAWRDVERANAAGYRVASRQVLEHPPPRREVAFPASAEPSDAAGPGWYAGAATAAGMALLEIVLLAGPAFAVGARRSRRLLGLMSASGADRRQLRAVVLADGLVLGAAGAAAGVLGGLAAAALARPRVEAAIGHRFGGWDLRLGELLGIGAVALATGLLAAVVPAVTAARQDVVAALAERAAPPRPRRRLPALLGAGAVPVGGAVAVAGAVLGLGSRAVLGGSALAELGLIACVPAIVAGLGRFGGRLPPAPRLALRDAVRNRARTAPAVAAVTAAVAGTVAAAVYSASGAEAARLGHVAAVARGSVAMTFDARALVDRDGRPDGTAHDAASITAGARRAVERSMPVTARVDLRFAAPVGAPRRAHGDPGAVDVARPPENACPYAAGAAHSAAERSRLRSDWRCAQEFTYDASQPLLPRGETVAVGGAETVAALLGRRDPGAARALAAGHAVVLNRTYAVHGRAVLREFGRNPAYQDAPSSSARPDRTVSVPAHTVAAPPRGAEDGFLRNDVVAVVPEGLAHRLGLRAVDAGAVWQTSRAPDAAERQRATGLLERVSPDAPPELRVEEGPGRGGTGVAGLVLPLFAGLVTLCAAGLATGLAAAESQRDGLVLVAMGAPGRLRRALAGCQCGLIALLGAVLGVPGGLVPAAGVIKAREYLATHGPGAPLWPAPFPVVVPWLQIAAAVCAVPLLAAVLAALFTRSSAGVRARRRKKCARALPRTLYSSLGRGAQQCRRGSWWS